MISILLLCLLSLLSQFQLSSSSLKLSATLKALTLSSSRLWLSKILRHSSNTSRTITQKSLSWRTTMNLWFSKLSSFKTLSVCWTTLLSLWQKRTQPSLSIKPDWKYNWRLYALSNCNSELQVSLSLRLLLNTVGSESLSDIVTPVVRCCSCWERRAFSYISSQAWCWVKAEFSSVRVVIVLFSILTSVLKLLSVKVMSWCLRTGVDTRRETRKKESSLCSEE